MTTASASARRGYLYVILGAVLWATSGVMGKFLFHKGVTPFQRVQLRVTLASLLLCGWFFLRPSLARIRSWRYPLVTDYGSDHHSAH